MNAALICESLCKTFETPRGAVRPLQNLSLRAEPGEIAAVVGESGCGKTTLLRIIAGLERAEAGRVRFEGASGEPASPRIGVVFQEHRLFPWMTVRENIELAVRRLPAPERRRRCGEILELVRLSGFEEAYPRELSGGMAQRVGLARALVGSPDVLLMDEPFGALDALTRHSLYREFVRVHAERPATTLLITHDVTEAVLLARHVHEIGGGRLLRTFDVPFPYPRTLSTPGLGGLSDRILATFLQPSLSSIQPKE
ncbi:ABC transporter ATP-binding protein [Mesosutterella sp. AGMB02718]|uniref:ABC transporter ATP-binding protein n=1 Tax=Mesosutterella faecium TaxID=2925194 RepID=A0ABT7IPZ2_9BURK|nr:ABC transporter ATP-binding protein [Mesosutterella sp. AGMB02718]MDL2060463.1 ABC transporter ATP-binding protein [Mesosutterella sp. AGMB02718]